jgi:F420-non-reducing hydrogenase iron-sulfur subunit
VERKVSSDGQSPTNASNGIGHMTVKRSFEPNILGFLCNWCCYAAADSAGVSRFQYPPNIRVIRIMCTGRMDPLFIVEAFRAGVDGVFVGG